MREVILITLRKACVRLCICIRNPPTLQSLCLAVLDLHGARCGLLEICVISKECILIYVILFTAAIHIRSCEYIG